MIALVADGDLKTEPAKTESECERPHKAEAERPTGKGTNYGRNSKEVRDGENAAQEERCPRIDSRKVGAEHAYEVENKCNTEEHGNEGMLAKKPHDGFFRDNIECHPGWSRGP